MNTFPNMNTFFIKCQDIASRLVSAKQFLAENPTESKTAASKIYDINFNTLISFIRRNTKIPKTEDQNKILKNHETETFHQFIKSLLLHNIWSFYEIVFNAILNLKHAHNSANNGSTKR